MSQDEIACLCFVLMFVILYGRRRYSRRLSAKDLDRPLLWLTKHDAYSVRNLLESALWLGRTGSGKTTSARAMLRAILRDPNSWGAIIGAKPEDWGDFQRLMRESGRHHPVVLFEGRNASTRLNFLAEAARLGDPARECTKFLMTVKQTLGRGQQGTPSANSQFFDSMHEKYLYSAIVILLAALGAVTAPDLQRFIVGAAQTPLHIDDDQWRRGFHSECIQKAHHCVNANVNRHDLELAIDFWLNEFPATESRLRSNILAGVLGILFLFCSGKLQTLCSTTSTFTFEELQRKRAFLFVDMSPTEYGDTGRFVSAGIKYLIQRFNLSRPAPNDGSFMVIWVDEAPQITNEFDAAFLAQCRSHCGCMVFLAQSTHSFRAAMKSNNGESEAMALLSHFGHRFCLSLGDFESAKWASNSLGERLETHFGGSSQPAASVYDELFGSGHMSVSFQTRFEPVLRPEAFMNNLRSGGRKHNYCCDVIVIRPGMPFSTGENYLRITFKQR